MLMRVINDEFGRLLFPRLYERFYDYLVELTPELNHDAIVQNWFARWMANDPTFFVFVDYEDNTIKAHTVFEIVQNERTSHIMVNQMKVDSKRDKSFIEEMDRMGKEMAKELKLKAIVSLVKKNERYYQDKLGYDVSRTFIAFDMDNYEG